MRSIVGGLSIAIGLCAMALASSSPASGQSPHRCGGMAREQAQKLLVFHVGADARIEIEKSVKTLASIRNPANRSQRLEVLEVWAHVYKGQYRMRFIFAPPPTDCVLMGQEILEYASL